jgi:hypothetical protein
VVLDAAGEADIYLDGLTKLLIKTSAGVTIDTVDNVMGAVSNYDSPTFNDLTVGDDLTVADDVAVGGDLAVTGDITCNDFVCDDSAAAGALSVAEDVTMNGGFILGAAVTHDYAAGAAAWTLSGAEELGILYYVYNSSGAADIIVAATELKLYILWNFTSHTITMKKAAATGIAVATGKKAILMGNTTDVIRLTADSA